MKINYKLTALILTFILIIVGVLGIGILVDLHRNINQDKNAETITIDSVVQRSLSELDTKKIADNFLSIGAPENLFPDNVLVKLSNGDVLFEFYDLSTDNKSFLEYQNPQIKNLTKSEQKIFYYNNSSSKYVYLDRTIRSLGQISDVKEVYKNGVIMIEFTESGRRIQSEPMLLNMKVV